MRPTATMGRAQYVPRVLYAAGMLVLLMSVLRPETTFTWLMPRTTVIIAMDISGSMLAEDMPPSRIAAAKAAAEGFIAAQPKDVHIGLVAFAETALLVQAPIRDREPLLAAVRRLEPQPGTAVGSGLLVALQAIDPTVDTSIEDDARLSNLLAPVTPGSNTSAVIALMSDGATTNGPDPIEAARVAAGHGVRVYTVGFGSAGGSVVDIGDRRVQVDLDEDTLRKMADITRAMYFHAANGNDLQDIYDGLTQEFLKERGRIEITALLCAAAALLLTCAVALAVAWTGRLL